MQKEVTGIMVYYYFVCKKKLWYFCNDLAMEHNSENVYIGKLIDENSYKRDKKHINIDNVINIDFIRDKKVLHEVKKSNKIEEASIWQVKYYLYYLLQRGVEVTGRIDYPILKETVDIILNEGDEEQIEIIVSEIKKIMVMTLPPECSCDKRICKACAYYELCYI